MTAIIRPTVKRAMTAMMMPTRAPILSVTAPFESEAVEADAMGIGMPILVPVAEAAAAPILLVNVLAYVLVRVVVCAFAVMVTVNWSVKTE
jgi:hypothetical protein